MSNTLLVLDLFCGLGGFGQAFRDRGHQVIGVDIVPPADVVADVRRLPFKKSFRPDVILASPPCTEYSREWMPWCRTGKEPDHSLMHAAYKAVATFKPRWWVIENVQGATPFWPPPPAAYRLALPLGQVPSPGRPASQIKVRRQGDSGAAGPEPGATQGRHPVPDQLGSLRVYGGGVKVILSEQLNGDWCLVDKDMPAPLMRISFYSEFKVLPFEVKRDIALAAFEKLVGQVPEITMHLHTENDISSGVKAD